MDGGQCLTDDGTKEWYSKGRLIRTEEANGDKWWYNADGSARAELADGSKSWYNANGDMIKIIVPAGGVMTCRPATEQSPKKCVAKEPDGTVFEIIGDGTWSSIKTPNGPKRWYNGDELWSVE